MGKFETVTWERARTQCTRSSCLRGTRRFTSRSPDLYGVIGYGTLRSGIAGKFVDVITHVEQSHDKLRPADKENAIETAHLRLLERH